MSRKIILAALAGTLIAAPAHAADDAALARMEARINALEHELADLKAEHRAFVEQSRAGQQISPPGAPSQPPAAWQQALVAPPAAAAPVAATAVESPAPPPPAPEISVSPDQTGLAVKNNKNDTLIRLRGFVQGDGRFLLSDGDHNGNDTFEAHRARLGFVAVHFGPEIAQPEAAGIGAGRRGAQAGFRDRPFGRSGFAV